jgi:hypothetical protein
LRNTDSNKRNSKDYLGPMRPYRGLPFAAGWAVVAIAGWAWAARHDFFGLALALPIAAFGGAYAILLLMGGLFTTRATTLVVLPHALGISV